MCIRLATGIYDKIKVNQVRFMINSSTVPAAAVARTRCRLQFCILFERNSWKKSEVVMECLNRKEQRDGKRGLNTWR
jgi:hypothetical protein